MRKHYTFLFALALLCFSVITKAQNVSVNPGAGSYPTLKAAFDAINAGTHTGAVTVTITANTTETATATLNASGAGSASYTSVQITPAGNVTVTGSLAAPLINLNGADNVTIDGMNSLTLSNTSTSTTGGTSTIRLINDASGNVITSCIIQGSSTLAANSTTATGVILLSTGTSTGNNNNSISNNDITSAGANLPSRGIASFGSTGSNSGNEVINNNIYNIFQATYSAAIQLNDNNFNWAISNNHIYQTATRNGSGTGINYGIWIDGATIADQFTITDNIIGYASNAQTGTYKITGASTTFQGISFTGKPSNVATDISGNTIASVTFANTSTAINYAINVNIPASGGIPVTIGNNLINNITGTGNMYSIAVTGAGTNRSSTISGNNINAFNLSGTARFYGILYNGGDGGTSSVITSNTIADISLNGTASGAATGSPALSVIYVASGPTSVTDNIIGSQTGQSISCTQASASTSSFDILGIFVKGVDNNTISNNTIGGLYADNTAATSGTARIFGIRNSSSGTITCANNIIGGTVANSIQVNSSFGGASVLVIYNSAGTGNFSGNTIRNVTAGAGTGTAANSSLVGIYNASASQTSATGNTIFNLSSQGVSAAGIIFAAGSSTSIAGNTIYNISGSGNTGAPVVSGIQLSGGTIANIYKNKIFGLSQTSPFTNAGGVNGILLSGGATVTTYNNIIGNLTAPAANSPDAIRGISITSTTPVTAYKIYYNTVYLNAGSGGSLFGSSALFQIGNAIATTATLDMKNNILVNTSISSGLGVTAALKRWPNTGTGAADLTNYDLTSNNNLLYAGIPSATKLIYSDSLNTDQTLAAFKAHVAPRESASVTEMPPFISVTGTDATYLHINTTVPAQVESKGVTIVSITDDYDANTRQGSAGYSGTGTAPDIGADEGEFTVSVMPVSLMHFTGEKVGDVNKLQWTTATETNNKGFIVERGIDGKNFSAIGTVASKTSDGNSTSAIDYSFIDYKILKSSAFYRLKQTDKDGRFTYSNIILLKRTSDQITASAVFPNPAKDIIQIAVSSATEVKLNLTITDMNGKTVLQQSYAVHSGDNLVKLNITHLTAGQYFIRSINEEGSTLITQRFIKQ